MTFLKVNQPKNYSNGWVGDFFNEAASFGKPFGNDIFTPLVNIKETSDAYHLTLSAAGRSKEDFKINLEKDLLTISSEKKEDKVAEDQKHIRKEFQLQSFKRSFTIDEKIDAEKIEAKYENGLLNVTLPKKEEVKLAPKEISIQ